MLVKPVFSRKLVIIYALVCVCALFADSALTEWRMELPESVQQYALAITEIGNSDWMFVSSLMGFAVLGIALKKTRTEAANKHVRLLLQVVLLFFLAILLSGIAVQIIKFLIGRPRPMVFEELGAYGFAPFSGGHFNSFPSGHSTTLGAAAMFVALWYPRQVWLILGIGLALSLSRFFSGWHYPADVLVGFAHGVFWTGLVARKMVARGYFLDARGQLVLGNPADLRRSRKTPDAEGAE